METHTHIWDMRTTDENKKSSEGTWTLDLTDFTMCKKTFECSLCGLKEEKVSQHIYMTNQNSCFGCGFSRPFCDFLSHGHQFFYSTLPTGETFISKDDITHVAQKKCITCGEMQEEQSNHRFKRNGPCMDCGYQCTKHIWLKNNIKGTRICCQRVYICTQCGAQDIKTQAQHKFIVINHDFYCDFCEYKKVYCKDCEYKNAYCKDCEEDPTCTVCLAEIHTNREIRPSAGKPIDDTYQHGYFTHGSDNKVAYCERCHQFCQHNILVEKNAGYAYHPSAQGCLEKKVCQTCNLLFVDTFAHIEDGVHICVACGYKQVREEPKVVKKEELPELNKELSIFKECWINLSTDTKMKVSAEIVKIVVQEVLLLQNISHSTR